MRRPNDTVTPDSGNSLFAGEATRVWAVAWPIVLTNLLNVTVGIVDLIMVGRVGTEAIAAVGMSRQVTMFIMVLMVAISGGASVLVARAYGAADQERVSEVAGRSIVAMVLASLLLVTPAGLLLSGPMLTMLGAESHVIELGRSYLYILFQGSVFGMFNFTITAILLGVGKTRISLILLIGINVCNVVLNYILIFGVGPVPALGVTGAALGTVTARGLGAFAGIWIARTPLLPIQATFRDGLRVNPTFLAKVLHLGGPRSLQGIVRNFSRLMTLKIITLLPNSTKAVSAYSVGMQVRMISSFVGLAFMAASMSRVGQNMGAGKPDVAEKSGWISAGLATGMMSVVAAAFFLFPEAIMGFFTDDGEVISMGRQFFVTIALTEPIMACAFALSGALRGGGDPISPFICASVSDLLVVILLGYLLAVQCHMGFLGIAIAMAISTLTRAIPVVLVFRRRRWKDIRL